MSDLPQISGPSFGPAAGGEPHNLVILLHGYGANGDDLIGLAPPFSQVLPHTEFLSPNAPYPCEANPFGGLQWFEVEVMTDAGEGFQLDEMIVVTEHGPELLTDHPLDL